LDVKIGVVEPAVWKAGDVQADGGGSYLSWW